MRMFTLLISLSICYMLNSCANYDFARREVQQGNLLTKEPASKRLHLGMTKEEVSIIMGTSLLSPTFASNRWDYVYTFRKGSGKLITHSTSVYFANERLVKIEEK